MDDEELAEYAARSKDLIQRSPEMDEANTKVRLIQPLISHLGWDVHSPEVELEYPVQMGTGTMKVDYALVLEETPVVFVEAKGCDTSISETHRHQLWSYMRIIGVDWGLLTNGRRFEVLKRRPDSDSPDESILGAFEIEELSEDGRLLHALSRESITSGESERIAEHIERVQGAMDTLRAERGDIARDVVNAVTDRLDAEVPIEIEDDAKEFVDDLIESLEEHDPVAGHREDGGEEANVVTESTDFWDRVEDEIGIRRVEGEIELTDDRTAVADFLSFIEFLFEEGYLTRGDLPYNPAGPKRYLINTEPEHIDGSEMYNPHQLFDGVFVETHNSTSDKKRYMTKLAEDFAGVEP